PCSCMTSSAPMATSPCVAPNQTSNACSPTSTASPKKTANSPTKLNPSKPIPTKSNPSPATSLAWLSPTKSSSKSPNPSNQSRKAFVVTNRNLSRLGREVGSLLFSLVFFASTLFSQQLSPQTPTRPR